MRFQSTSPTGPSSAMASMRQPTGGLQIGRLRTLAAPFGPRPSIWQSGFATCDGTIRLGGPRGVAAIGPRTWARVLALGGPEVEDQAEALVDVILASLEARGFEEFYPANLLCLDGRTGKEVLASLLPPGVDTLLRDPEYVLLSRNLEAGPDEPLMLLSFDAMEAAFPGRLHWLDERTCAVPAIDPASWSVHVQRLEPMLTPLTELLDGPDDGDSEAWRKFVPDGDPGPGSRQ